MATRSRRDDFTPAADSRKWHRWQDWVNMAVGAWLLLSPWILGTTLVTGEAAQTASANAWVLGIIVAAFGLWALSDPRNSAPEWGNTLAGLWLFISPWALGFYGMAMSQSWNQWIAGAIVFVLAIWTALGLQGQTRRHAGRHIEHPV